MEEYGLQACVSIPGHYLINFRKAILEQVEDKERVIDRDGFRPRTQGLRREWVGSGLERAWRMPPPPALVQIPGLAQLRLQECATTENAGGRGLKLVEPKGVEPSTSALRTQRSPN